MRSLSTVFVRSAPHADTDATALADVTAATEATAEAGPGR